MADNLNVTPGTGAVVAADEVVDAVLGTVKVGYGKIMDGTPDSTNKLVVTTAGEAKVLAGSISVIKATILANTVGDTTVYTPSAGKAVRLLFFGFSAGAGVTGNLAQIKLAGYNGGAVVDSQYLVASGQAYSRNLQGGKRYVQGSANGLLAVTLSAAQNVYVNYELEEI